MRKKDEDEMIHALCNSECPNKTLGGYEVTIFLMALEFTAN